MTVRLRRLEPLWELEVHEMHFLLAPPERGVEGDEEFDARQGLRGRKGRFCARDVPREAVDARRWGVMFFSARGRWSYLLVDFTL